MATAAKLVIDVDAKGVEKADGALKDLEGSAKKAASGVKGLTKAEKQAATATQKLAKDTANLKRQVAGLATSFLGMAAAAKAIAIASDFSEAAATVKAITQATDSASKSYIELEAQARKLGATTRFTATQAAEAQVALLRSGLAANEVLAASAHVLNLATVAQIDLARAAEITAITLKQFGLHASQAERVVDVLSFASNTAATTVEQLAEGMKFAAPVASKFGLTLEDTTAALAVLSNAGLQASLAGTGLKGVISALANPTGKAAATLQQLAKNAGLTADAFDINVRPLEEIFVNFKKAEAGGKDMLNIFGLLKAPAALTLTNAADEIAVFADRLDDVEGSAQTAADTINAALKGDILKLVSALQELVLVIMDSVGPSLSGFIQFLTEVINALGASDDEFHKFSSAAKLAANSIKFLSLVVAAFVAIKLVTAIGSAVIAIKAMILALVALRTAIASTGIGLLVVGLGIAGAAALEMSGAFDDAAKSTDDLNAAGRTLAEEEQARERLRAQQAENGKLRHQESMDAIAEAARVEREADKERKKAEARREAAGKKARAARQKQIEHIEKLNKKINAIEPELEFQIQLADLGPELAKDVLKEMELLKLVADRFEMEITIAPDDNVTKFLDELTEKLGKEKFFPDEIDNVVFEVETLFARVSVLQQKLEEKKEFRIDVTAGEDAIVMLSEAALKAETDLEAMAGVGIEGAALTTAAKYQEQLDAIRLAAERAFTPPDGSQGILPENFIALLHQGQVMIDRLARTEFLAPLILDGKTATEQLELLGQAGDFTATSLGEFGRLAETSIAGYRAQIQAGIGDTEDLEAAIVAVDGAFAQFAENVAKQDLLDSFESVVVSTTVAMFDLFETLIDGSKTAGEAFADFIKVVIRALFEKFVVEATINAIAKGFDAIGAAVGVGNVGSAGAEAGGALGAVASADGNVFRGGAVVQAFADGGIIGGPTVFPLGLAGEAGPEAIMPLSRGPNGKLGVQMNGREARRPGTNPFINRSLSQGASDAPSVNELRGSSSRTTNVQMNIVTQDAKSFRRSKRQIQAEMLQQSGIQG